MKTYLKVPYSEEDDAKMLGAKFDWVKKSWYIEDDDMRLFVRWLPQLKGIFPQNKQNRKFDPIAFKKQKANKPETRSNGRIYTGAKYFEPILCATCKDLPPWLDVCTECSPQLEAWRC